MKFYNKPVLDVVKLSVKENLAALPKAATVNTQSTTTVSGTNMPLTTYNLSSVNKSTYGA